MILRCQVDSKTFEVALVQPYDAPLGTRPRKDSDLGLYRLRARPQRNSEFFMLDSIIRGAVLVPDFGKDGDYFVHDLIDTDIFLRMLEWRSRRQA